MAKYMTVVAITAAAVLAAASRAAEPNAVRAKGQKSIQTNAAKIVKLAYLQSTGHIGTDYVKGTAFPAKAGVFVTFRHEHAKSNR